MEAPWEPDWRARFAALEWWGLPAVWTLTLLPGDDWRLPREASRPHLHLSICFDGEADVEAVRAAWHGRRHTLWGYRCGSCFYVHPADPMAQCPHLNAAHERGWYRDRPLHLSM